MAMPKGGENRPCILCGNTLYLTPGQIKDGIKRFCSKKCARFAVSKKSETFIPTDVKMACLVCKKEYSIIRARSKKGEGLYCSIKCFGAAHTGKDNRTWKNRVTVKCLSCEIYFTAKDISENSQPLAKYCSRRCAYKGRDFLNDKNPNWRNGSTALGLRIRTSKLYLDWRIKVFERDNFICVNCGYKEGGILNAHHKTPFFIIIKHFGLDSMEKAKECELLWDIDNGETVCEECHKKEHKIVRKSTKYKFKTNTYDV